MTGLMNTGWTALRRAFFGMALAGGLVSGGTVAAATLDQMALGALLFDQDGLIVTQSSDDAASGSGIFEAADLPFFEVFVSAQLNGAGGIGLSGPNDLEIVDPFFDPILNGSALDILVDSNSDVISVLYSLGDNTLSGDSFAVAQLSFAGLDFDGSFLFSDFLDEEVNLEIYGATVVPLPAGLPLMFAGIAALALFRRQQRS